MSKRPTKPARKPRKAAAAAIAAAAVATVATPTAAVVQADLLRDVIPNTPPESPLWLPYQQRWQADRSPTRVCEKSRRVGLDYVESFQLVAERMTGVTNLDAWYSSADEDAGKEFMEYVKGWCKVFGEIIEIVEEYEWVDDKQVRVLTARLPLTTVNGITRAPRITALSSNPRQFRGKGGDVRLSEFAFHKDQKALWKAAQMCTAWGGTLAAWSTHDGEETYFNELVQMGKRKRSGEKRHGDADVSLHTVTLDLAVSEGLVTRINEKGGRDEHGIPWTDETFVAAFRAKYTDQADWDEETGCIPRGGATSFLPYTLLRPCVVWELPVVRGLEAKPRRVLRGIVGDAIEFFAGLVEVSLDADVVCLGSDIGRAEDGDPFALAVAARRGGLTRLGPVFSKRGLSFDIMEGLIVQALNMSLPGPAGRIRRAMIDNAGLGMQLAERMERRFLGVVDGINTAVPAWREEAWTRVNVKCQEKTLALPDDAGLLAQFAGVRKRGVSGGRDRYDIERNKHGHGDGATACALALHADNEGDFEPYDVDLEEPMV